jgi:hypothetical protein
VLSARVDARPLAVARVGIGIAGFLILLELRGTLMSVAAGRMAVPVLSWAPAVSWGLVAVWSSTGVVAAVTLVLGRHSRSAAGVLAAVVALGLLWDQQTYSSHVFLLGLLAGYLSCTDAGAAWSVDARRRGERRSVAFWPQLLIHTQLTAVYLFAGLSKLNADYLSGEPLKGWLPVSLPLRVTASLALLSVLTELFVAAGTWHRVTRPAAFAVGVALHLTIVATLTPTVPLIAFSLLCVSCYPMFAVTARTSPSPEAAQTVKRNSTGLRPETTSGH